MKCDIRNHSSMSGIEKVAENLYKYAQKKLGFDKPARVVFESHGDRAVDLFSPTAHYSPQTRTIKIFVDHRHPKDILRSMAHELIHHAQHCQGAFDEPMDTSPGYAQKDQRMRDLERDAYFWGNGILFRDWEDNHKQRSTWNLMNENKKMSLNEQKLRKKVRRMIRGILLEQEMPPVTATTLPTAATTLPPMPEMPELTEPLPSPTMPTTTTEPPTITQPPTGTKTPMEEGKGHSCASHVKENLSGRQGRCINHTLLEDGSVTHYTVEFQNEIVENIPVGRLTILEMNEHMHSPKRDDYPHSKDKVRVSFEEAELKNPEKADLDDDGELSGYEKARGAAIEKAMNEEEAVEEAHCGKRDDDEEGVDEAHCGKRDDDEGEELQERSTEDYRRSSGMERQAAQSSTPVADLGGDIKQNLEKQRRRDDAGLEEEQPLKEWYNNTLHEALLKKFKIKK